MRDLNDLAFFAAVVAHRGFSAAARALSVPKSRVSRRVMALETRLGVRLVERSTRRFSVTEVGQDVYRHARAALAEADAVEEVALKLKSEPQGVVRVSCPATVDRRLAADLPRFLKRFPRLRVRVVVTNRRVDLIEEGFDVAIRVREKLDTDADLQMRTIGRTSLMLVASPAFLDAHGRPTEPEAIASLPTLAHAERPGLDRWVLVDAADREAVIAHEPRLAASDFPMLRHAAIEGVGIALLPEFFCGEAIETGVLERVLPGWFGRQGILHLVFTSRRGVLPGVRAFIDFAATALDLGSPGWRVGLG